MMYHSIHSCCFLQPVWVLVCVRNTELLLEAKTTTISTVNLHELYGCAQVDRLDSMTDLKTELFVVQMVLYIKTCCSNQFINNVSSDYV